MEDRILSELLEIEKRFSNEIKSLLNEDEVQQFKSQYLHKQHGRLSQILKQLPQLSLEARKSIGQRSNQIKREMEQAIKIREEELSQLKAQAVWNAVDITQPGTYLQTAPVHIMHQVLDDCIEILERIGFVVADGPEVEIPYYNFTALNFPDDHPAMEMHDTFYVSEKALLRTHTSPVQIRVMEKQAPPVAIISPGLCYRCDTPDATHSPVFHQVEGLYVDHRVSFSDLKGILTYFYQAFFSPDVKLRFRPSFFPFTEPSAEVDISCIFCGGKGCRICKQTGWLEVAGAGMVDPGVFRFVNYDPEIYSGYAFGMGVERLAILKYQIPDIRLFMENDINFLKQF